MAASKCKVCGREIVFAKVSTTGKWVALDPLPSPDGRWECGGSPAKVTARWLSARAAKDSRRRGGGTFIAHGRTCRVPGGVSPEAFRVAVSRG